MIASSRRNLGRSVWFYGVCHPLHNYRQARVGDEAVVMPRGTNIYHCGAGRVTIRRLPTGVAMAAYSGVIGVKCFDNLRQTVIEATRGASVIILDMTAMLSTTVLVPPIPADLYQANAVPGVVICREDQISVWQNYAGAVAELGIMRIVVLDSERALAQSVANSLAGV